MITRDPGGLQKTAGLIRTGTNEIMSMSFADEWYKKYQVGKKASSVRDREGIAAKAQAEEEKIREQTRAAWHALGFPREISPPVLFGY